MTYNPNLVVQSALTVIVALPARSLAAVAAECAVSRQTLDRAFRRCGLGSTSHIRNEAIHTRMAALMTAHPPKSIKEISGALGFATPRSFARWLKREDGIVPCALRDDLCRRGAADADGGDSLPPRTSRHRDRFRGGR